MISRTVAWLTLFLIGTDLFVVSPLLPDIADAVGTSTGTAGFTVTVFSLAYLFGGPTFGAVADRRGRLLVLTAALAVFAVANLATALSPDLAVLLISRVVAGLSAAGITPSVYALISASAPAEQRARWLAVVTSGLLLALATGAPAGSLLAGLVGWRGVFGVLAAVSMILLIVIRVRATRTPTRATAAANPNGATGPAPTVLQRVRAVSVTGLWALSVYGVYTFLGTILDDTLHTSALVVALTLVAYGVGAVIGNLAGGQLADRWGARPTSLASLVLLAVAMLGVALTVRIGVGALIPVLLVLGLVAYPFFAAQQARLSAAFPGVAGTVLAWNNSSMYAGILIGSAVGGSILQAAGPSVLAVVSAAVAVVGTGLAFVSAPATRPATPRVAA